MECFMEWRNGLIVRNLQIRETQGHLLCLVAVEMGSLGMRCGSLEGYLLRLPFSSCEDAGRDLRYRLAPL